MRLYVEPMDAVVVEVSSDGRVRLEEEDWSTPTLQERRAIIYAAKGEIEALNEIVEEHLELIDYRRWIGRYAPRDRRLRCIRKPRAAISR